MAMASSPPHRTTILTGPRTVADDLAAEAAAQRPDLASAFADGGWVAVEIHNALLTRDVDDFVVYSARTETLTGLRHGEHFAFVDDDQDAG